MVWRNMAQKNRHDFVNTPGPKCWARIYRAAYEADAQGIVEKMSIVISKAVGVDRAHGLIVSPPTTEEDLAIRRPPPYHFLVSGLTEEAVTFLLALVVLSTSDPDLIIIFVPFTQPIPTYIGTIERLCYRDNEESSRLIADLVKSTIRSHHDILSYAQEHLESPDPEAVSNALASIRATSLRIKVSGGETRTVWNIYIDRPPRLPLAKFYTWANFIRNLTFESSSWGTGTVRQGSSQFFCQGCKSLDHTTWGCPMTRTLGWFGPVAPKEEDSATSDGTTTEKEPTMAKGKHGRNTGGRQRGRGRGFNGMGGARF